MQGSLGEEEIGINIDWYQCFLGKIYYDANKRITQKRMSPEKDQLITALSDIQGKK